MAGTVEFATCYVADQLFGIEVAQVQEVTGGGHLTRLPLAPRPVCGLLNLRGQIVAAIDLRACLHLGQRAPGQLPVHVILKTGAGSVSVVVDRVGDVLAVDESAFEQPPETMSGRIGESVRGAYKLDTALLLALDIESLLNQMERTSEMGDMR